MKMKKVTQKDRYGNQISYEYEPDTKPLDITSLFEKLLDKDIPEYLEIPESPIGGSFTAGFAPAHPGGPKGQDTVPAWLTPGEFVVNREGMEDPQDAAMVEQINNKGRAKQMAKGGMMPQGYAFGGRIPPIHYEDGGSVPVPMSPTEALLRQREGFRSDVYLDSLGKPTVGHGHLLPEEYIEREGETPFTDQQLDQFFYEDQETAEAAAKRNAKKYGVKWDDLNRREQTALTSMAFQLGETGQGKFENMWTKLAAGDKQGAALEALDSAWAGQTPQRAKDVHDAFTPGLGFNAGGPIYAYRGIDVAQQDAFDIEDPNADLSAGWTPPVYDENEISPMEQAILDEEAAAAAAPPPVEEPPQIQESVTEDMGLLGKAIDWFGGPSDISQIEHEERLAQQARGAAADKEQEIAGYEAAAEEKEIEAEVALNAGDYAEYARLRKESQQQHAAAEAAKVEADEIAERQAAQDAAFADNQAIRDDATAAEKKREMLEAIATAEAAGDTEAVAALTEKLDEATDDPGPADDAAALEELATSPEFEEEDDPSKPSDKGQQTPEQVVAEGKKQPPAMIEKAKGFFKDAFSDLFDGKELARMAIMYAGSRALGYSHGGSLNWAAKQYVGRLDAKQTALNDLIKSGKYTPASIEAYKKSGDIGDLQAPGITPKALGNFKTFFSPQGQQVRAEEYDLDGAKVWMTPDGRRVNAQWSEDKSLVPGTKEYSDRIKNDSKQYGDMISGLRGQFGTIDKENNVYATELVPEVAGNKVAKWAIENKIPPEYMGSIVEGAYHAAIADAQESGRKVRDLTPYLNAQFVSAQVGDVDLFKDKSGKVVSGRKVQQAITNIQSLVPNTSTTAIIQAARGRWNALPQEERDRLNKQAGPGESGFLLYIQKETTKAVGK